jgi:hypothetical protein
LPRSLLRTTFDQVAVGIVHAQPNVPYDQLMGLDQSREQPNSLSPRATMEKGGARETRIFRHVPAAVKTALWGARSKYPTLTVQELMAAHDPPLPYAQIKMGPSGTCLDYLCFGACKNAGCNYKHVEGASVPASRAEAVAPKLAAAYKTYDSLH